MKLTLVNQTPVDKETHWVYHVDKQYTLEIYKPFATKYNPDTNHISRGKPRSGLVGVLHPGIIAAGKVGSHMSLSFLGTYGEDFDPKSRATLALLKTQVGAALLKHADHLTSLQRRKP